MGSDGTERHGIVAGVPATLKATVTELPESRVRVRVEVPPGELEDRIEQRARKLGRELKLPGFRKGKVPAPLVLQRVGREAVLEEAVRDTLSRWYSDAIETAGIVPVGDPQLDLGDLPPQGQALEFSIEIGVLPKAELGAYEGLEVPRREPTAAEEQVTQQIEEMRERLARLETVEREAAEGDFVVVDYVGYLQPEDVRSDDDPARAGGGGGGDGDRSDRGEPFEGGEGRDQLIELGGGNLIPGFEEGLLGAGAGETRTIELAFPADYGAEHLAGRDVSFEIAVKEVKQKHLPEVDEDFAIDAGFDTVAELRADIESRLLEAEEQKIEGEFREAALDAAVAQATVPVTPALAEARAKEMWERMLHSLSHNGISREAYLQITGREESAILAEMQPDAEQGLRREAVVTAIVAAEAIAPSDDEVLVAIGPTAEREGVAAEKLLEDLHRAGRLEDVREDLAARQAVEWVAERAKPISVEQAQAREQLWTPEQEQAQGKSGAGAAVGEPAGLWTPGS
jgi:trigger factor